MANVLVIAAHADDEALGCGGTMAAHAARGDRVRALFMTDGVGARGGGDDAEAAWRREACRAACAVLGAEAPVCLDFPDNGMDAVPLLSVARGIEAALADFRPDVVYTHHAQDLNVDHRVTHEATMTALRPQPGAPRPTILCFEVASSTEWRAPSAAAAFLPTWYEDVSATWPLKRRALEAYAREMRPWPHARSLAAVEHLARWRGASVGLEAAEAFQLARHVGGGPLPAAGAAR